jgi:hypothetical protein
MTKQRIKLVVAGEHSLGYITPEQPDQIFVLNSSILKGAPACYPDGPHSYQMPMKHRLATPEDFDTFRVSPIGFIDNPSEYECAQAH